MRYTLSPSSTPGAIYLLDSCSPPTWPDRDSSGTCGSNEFAAESACGYVGCYPLIFDFYYPTELEGSPTSPKTFRVVLDEVNGVASTDYQLEWEIE